MSGHAITPSGVAAVIVGGMAGTALRIGTAEMVDTASYPWATLVVNLLGAALLGWLVAAYSDHAGEWWLLFATVGALGAFTTFSTFVADTDRLMDDHSGLVVVGYLTASVVGGLAAARAGMRVRRT